MSGNTIFLSYTDEDWRKLASLARQQSVLSGFYNENYRFVKEGRAFLFRFPRENETQMDPRPFYEGDVYRMLKNQSLPVPEYIYQAPDKSFQVHEYIEGALIDEIYPSGQKIPEQHIAHIAGFYAEIAAINIDVSDYLAADWPRKGPPLTFFEKLLERSWIVYRDHQETHGEIYKFLKIPDDPFSIFLKKAGKLTKRPWRLIHADVHRGNMIEREDGSIIIIDWELAQYGDLLHCIARHLHLMRYTPQEREHVAREIYKALPGAFKTNFMKDLDFYLGYEAIRSIINDTVRFPLLLKRKKVSRAAMHELSVYYADNLNRVSGLLGTKTAMPEKVLEWFEEWAI